MSAKVVRKTESPQTQGDEGDHGTDTFHKTPSLVPILVGGVQCAPTPELFGPRNPGQEAGALKPLDAIAVRTRARSTLRFIKVGEFPWTLGLNEHLGNSVT